MCICVSVYLGVLITDIPPCQPLVKLVRKLIDTGKHGRDVQFKALDFSHNPPRHLKGELVQGRTIQEVRAKYPHSYITDWVVNSAEQRAALQTLVVEMFKGSPLQHFFAASLFK